MLFGLLIAPLLVSGGTCPVYKCGKSSTTTGECIHFSNSTGVDTYSITPCIQGLACDFVPETSSMCQYPTDFEPRYPGEYCAENQDCASGVCSGVKCLGLTANSVCTSSSQCNPGLYCSSVSPAVCISQIPIGSPCNKTIQCANSGVCDSGICTTYFSKGNGNTTTVIDYRGIALACTSGFASNGVCTNPPVSNFTATPTAIPCKFNTSCYAKDGVHKKTCLCSYDGDSYCPLFEGDTPVQKLIAGMPNIYLYNGVCHTMNRFGYACFVNMAPTVFAQYLTWSANAELYWGNQWVYSHTTQKCVNETIQKPYLNLVEQSTTQYYQCPMFSSTNTTSRWATNQCIFAANDIYYDYRYISVQANKNACPVNTTCYATPNSYGNVTCSKTNLRYPGDYCSGNNQCESLSCINNVCIGISLGQTCVYATDCNPGLFCNFTSFKCEYNVPIGGDCTHSYACQNNLTCNLGTCIQLFSLAIGQAVDNATNYGYSQACASGFAAYDTTKLNKVCATAPISSGVVNALCNPGSVCNDSTGVYTKICQCGTNGNAYCPTFEGDPAAVKMNSYHQKFANYSTNCNSANIDAYCFKKSSSMMKNYENYYINYVQYYDGPTLNGTEDSFLADLYFSEYWTAYENVHDSSSYGSVLALSVAALIAFSI